MIEFERDLVAAAARWYDPRQRRRRRTKRAARLAGGLTIAAAAAVGLATAIPDRQAAPLTVAPTPAPSPTSAPFIQTNGASGTLPAVFGKGSVHLGSNGRSAHLLTFGASWCSSCTQSLPAVIEAQGLVAAAGGHASYADSRDHPRDFRGVPHASRLKNVGSDRSGRFADLWRVHAFPTDFLIDPEGVPHKHAGPMDPEWVTRGLTAMQTRHADQVQPTKQAFSVLRTATVSPPPHMLSRIRPWLVGSTDVEVHRIGSASYAALSPAGLCFYTPEIDQGTCFGDQQRLRDGTNPTMYLLPDGRVRLEAFVPDGTTDMAVHYLSGRTVPLTITDNLGTYEFSQAPKLLTFTAPDGTPRKFQLDGGRAMLAGRARQTYLSTGTELSPSGSTPR